MSSRLTRETSDSQCPPRKTGSGGITATLRYCGRLSKERRSPPENGSSRRWSSISPPRSGSVTPWLLNLRAFETRVRTLAYWQVDRLGPNVEYDLQGTPCQDVVRGNLCHHPAGVARAFPADRALAELGIESYLGVPLVAPDGRHLGSSCRLRHEADAGRAEEPAHLQDLRSSSRGRTDPPPS